MARPPKRELTFNLPAYGVGVFGWVKPVHGGWALFSALGEVLMAADDRTYCYFGAASMGLTCIILN